MACRPAVIREHIAMNRRIAAWMGANRPELRAGRFARRQLPVCKISRRLGVPVVHMVAPQLGRGALAVRKLSA